MKRELLDRILGIIAWGLIAKTIPFIDRFIAEKALAGEPNYRRY